MRKSVFTLLLVLLNTPLFLAQKGWFWQNPTPTGNSLNHVTFIDKNIGWAVGLSGTIIKTVNGGLSWELQKRVTTNTLNCVDFIDENIGLVVGDNNSTILKTTDEGINWNELKISRSYNLNTLKFFDDNNGLIGTDKSILRTTDGGASWSETEIDDMYGVTSFSFVDNKIGFASAIITYKTTDAGETWEPIWILSGKKPEESKISFIDSKTGWAVGYNTWNPWFALVSKTTDGGTSWIAQTIDTNRFMSSISFINEKIGWIVGDSGRILYTNNGGTDWNKYSFITSHYLYQVLFVNETTGWIVGSGGTILKTTTGNIANVNMNQNSILEKYALTQNYPNPFNPATKIEYSIPKTSFVTLRVFDILGREVATLVNEEKPAGSYKVEFNGKELPSGIYFYELQAEDFFDVKKMVLIK